jgi:hypothetical protein
MDSREQSKLEERENPANRSERQRHADAYNPLQLIGEPVFHSRFEPRFQQLQILLGRDLAVHQVGQGLDQSFRLIGLKADFPEALCDRQGVEWNMNAHEVTVA